MKHDAWVNDLFLGTQLKLEPSGPLSHAHMSSVLCDLWSDCTCQNVACGRCISLQVNLSPDHVYPPGGVHFNRVDWVKPVHCPESIRSQSTFK